MIEWIECTNLGLFDFPPFCHYVLLVSNPKQPIRFLKIPLPSKIREHKTGSGLIQTPDWCIEVKWGLILLTFCIFWIDRYTKLCSIIFDTKPLRNNLHKSIKFLLLFSLTSSSFSSFSYVGNVDVEAYLVSSDLNLQTNKWVRFFGQILT